MMHSFPPLGQKTGDRTIRIGWTDEFDPAGSGTERYDFDGLLLQQKTFAASEPQASVAFGREIEVGNHNRDVMQRRVGQRRRPIHSRFRHQSGAIGAEFP
jgi:hypothetical protein